MSNGELDKAGIECSCGSKDTVYTGQAFSQEADASRGMPMMEGEEVACLECHRVFYY